MALIKCVRCGTEFSDENKNCPTCGCSAEDSLNQITEENKGIETNAKEKKGLLRGALGVAAKGLKNAAEVADDISTKGDDSEYVKKAKGFMANAADKTVSAAKKAKSTIDKRQEKNVGTIPVEVDSDTESQKNQSIPQMIPVEVVSDDRIDETVKETEQDAQSVEVSEEPTVISAPSINQTDFSPKKRDRKQKLRIFGLILLALLVVFYIIGRNSMVEMPDVSDMNAVKAKQVLEEAGFNKDNIVFKDKENKKIKKPTKDWIVETQEQTAGEEISKDEEIVLHVINSKQEKEAAEAKKAEEEKKKKEKAEEKKKKEKAEKASAEEKQKIEALKGQRIANAVELEKQLGYHFTYTHSVSGDDFTEQIPLDPDFYGSWLIMGVESVNPTAKTATMLVNAEENQKRIEEEQNQTAALENKLSKTDAFIAMEQYGKQQFPKFDLKWMGNELAARAEDDSTWFLKTYCNYTDAYGVERKGVEVEAYVSGTVDNPVITKFYVYE